MTWAEEEARPAQRRRTDAGAEPVIVRREYPAIIQRLVRVTALLGAPEDGEAEEATARFALCDVYNDPVLLRDNDTGDLLRAEENSFCARSYAVDLRSIDTTLVMLPVGESQGSRRLYFARSPASQSRMCFG